MTRYQRPGMGCLRDLQAHSTRGWVYRQEQGWVFETLTPDELAEFKSYGERAPRIAKVRFPHGPVVRTFSEFPGLGNQFAYCTLMQVHSVALARFQIQKVDEQRTNTLFKYTLEAGSYEAWLWADEIAICRELGCEITVRAGWGWEEWGPPATTPPRPWYKERTFIYALADPFTQEVRYVGKSDNPRRRFTEHLNDTINPDKVEWIRGMLERGYEPTLIILEEVAGEDAPEREYYWIVYYWDQGSKLTNDYCSWWNDHPENPLNHSFRRRQHARSQRDINQGIPSKETRSTWIHAFRKAGDYPEDTEFSGQWLIWLHAAMIDRYWQMIKESVEQGWLGNEAKVTTARSADASIAGSGYRGNEIMSGKCHLICVCTYDWTDIIDVMGIRQVLRDLGIKRTISYRSNEDMQQLCYGSDYTPIYRA